MVLLQSMLALLLTSVCSVVLMTAPLVLLTSTHVSVAKLLHVVVLRSVDVTVPKLARMLVLKLPHIAVLRIALLTVVGTVLLVSMHVLLLKVTCLTLSSAEHWRYHQRRSLGSRPSPGLLLVSWALVLPWTRRWSSRTGSVFPPTRQQCGMLLVVGVVVVKLASLMILLSWGRVEERCHRQCPPGPPRAPVAPHSRRDELQHRCLPPLQLMSSKPRPEAGSSSMRSDSTGPHWRIAWWSC